MPTRARRQDWSASPTPCSIPIPSTGDRHHQQVELIDSDSAVTFPIARRRPHPAAQLNALIRHARARPISAYSLYPKDMPLLVSMGIAIYIAFVAVFYIPYAIIWRCIRTVPKRCARIPMLVWHLRDWFDRLLRKIAPRKSERTRHAVEFDDDAWQIIQDGARKRGIPPNKYLTELAMRAPDDWIDSNSWRR